MRNNRSKRSTIYFEPVRQLVQEDQQDFNAFAERADEVEISYEELLEDLKLHGKI